MRSSLVMLFAAAAMVLVLGGTASALTYNTDVLTGATINGPADAQDGVMFGTGNANGGFTVGTGGGIELGLRTHDRYAGDGAPDNDFNFVGVGGGDGLYAWNTGGYQSNGTPGGPRGEWNFDWSIFVSNGSLTDYTYEMGVDYDPSGNAQYATWDLINNPTPDVDHAILTSGGTAINALSGPNDPATNYANNVTDGVAAQNSWNMAFMNGRFPALNQFNPNVAGNYRIYLNAYDSSNTLVASTAIQVLVGGAPAVLPEPATMTVFGLGLAGMALAGWRKKRAA